MHGSTGFDREQMRLAAEQLNKHKDYATPAHAASAGHVSHRCPDCGEQITTVDGHVHSVVSEDKPRDLNRADPDMEKGKKRDLRWHAEALADQLAARLDAEQAHSSSDTDSDGVSHRPAHDPVVPYSDMPGDAVASLPMCSTAPVAPTADKRLKVDQRGRVTAGAPRSPEAAPDATCGPGADHAPKPAQVLSPSHPHPMNSARHVGSSISAQSMRNAVRDNPS